MAHFRHLIVDADWYEAGQQYQFWWGRREDIKDEMTRVEMPTGLDDFIDLIICINNQLQEWRDEKGGYLQPPCTLTIASVPVSPTELIQVDLVH